MPMTRDEVYEKVRAILCESLGADEDEVSPDATLRSDLGAESIDFLDIVFQLEKEFSIKIPRGELFPDDVISNPEYVANGKLTAAGLTTLKQRLPHVDFSLMEDDPDINRMPELFKVQTIVDFVVAKIGA